LKADIVAMHYLPMEQLDRLYDPGKTGWEETERELIHQISPVHIQDFTCYV